MNRNHASVVIGQVIDLEFTAATEFFRRSPSADAYNRLQRLMQVLQFWHTLEPGPRSAKTEYLMTVPMVNWLGKLYDDATRDVLMGSATFAEMKSAV